MQWLLNILKSRFFLASIGLVLLVGAIVLVGRWLEWSLTIQLTAIIGVLLLTLISLGVSFVRANQRAAHIEQSIRQQAEQQVLSTRPDKRGEIEELRQQLDRAIETLKQSKLGRGQRGESALYALPWYMIIGPPGAGKTTAIANSGLNFPLGNQRVQGMGGTRNCDWFFSDSAILLDTAGRYMTEQEDTEEWRTFLEMLKENRRSQPINGVIVGISIAELAEAAPDEIEWHARNIRRRIDELVEILNVKFPVYLVFTKCDLLKGFVEFFGERTRREREQVWGSTLTAEQQEAENLRSVFESEFDRLTDALLNRRSARLRRSMKREDRHAVYAFPLQFAAVKDNLSLFVDLLFQQNPYQENPTFRGFYFTSGTQEGVPIDQVIQNIARQFDLQAERGSGFDPQMEKKSYFLKDLFAKVIIPDRYMVQRTSSATRRSQLIQAGIATAAVVLLAGFVLATSQALVRSRANLNHMRNAAAQVEQLEWGGSGDIMDKLARLDLLRGQLDNLEGWSPLRLGLSRDRTVLEPARALYLQHVHDLVEVHFRGPLDEHLQTVIVSGQADDRAETIDRLKAYLLISRERGQLEDNRNHNFLEGYLGQQIGVALAGSTEYSEPDIRRRLQPHVAAFVGAVHNGEVDPLEEDPMVARRVCEIAYRPPSISSIYRSIRLAGRARMEERSVTLSDIVPSRAAFLFRSNAQVPGFYSKAAVNDVMAEIERESADPNRDDWVCRTEQSTNALDQWNSREMAEKLRQLYFSEYGEAWEGFLRSVQLKPFGSVQGAARALDELNKPNSSPLLHVLAKVIEQTRFPTGPGTAVDLEDQVTQPTGEASSGDSSAAPGERHPLNARFQWLHALNADRAESGEAPALTESITPLGSIQQIVTGIADNGGPAAAEIAASVLQNNGGEIGNQLQSIQSVLPARTSLGRAVRRAFFEQPVFYAWEIIVTETQNYLNRRWQEEVYEPFNQNLADLYPLDSGARMEAPINDVQRFFGSHEGPLMIVDTELRPFLGANLNPRTWQGHGIRLSPAAKQAVEKSRTIHDVLYTGDVMQLTFELKPELPEEGDHPPVNLYDLTIHGTNRTYDMGLAQWTRFTWPGSPGAHLSVSTQQGDVGPRQHDGDWAWFRLLEDAEIRRQSPTEYVVRWTFERPGRFSITVPYQLRVQTARSPFDSIRSFFNFQPPETLD